VPIPKPLAQRLQVTQTSGVEILAVEIGTPADGAGLQEEDIILSLGDKPTTTVDDLHKLLTELPVGVPSMIVIIRGERRLERLVVPGEYPHVMSTS
jgi:S1-C subfamily serine protease